MENKIISINIGPDADEEINENAGVMWEHNATSLVFDIDPSYVGDYRYYIEYRSLIGTKVRTEYLELNIATNTITYNIPVTMTCLRGVECYFNIVNIDEDGNTIQVIKPKRFYLQFDYAPDTDNSLEKANDFSINALLEAIRLGVFQGGSGGTVIVDSKMSDTSSNPVQNKIVKAYVDNVASQAVSFMNSREYETLKTIEDFVTKNFVIKESGKALSSNDFTDAYKNKLDSVDTNPATRISSISESTEYGKSSVITFNDGNTLTVKNGTKGVNGYTPVKGLDYWTEDDKTAIQDDCNRYIADQLADHTQLIPEFVNNTNDCTDTTKLYVLPDGFIYAYMYSESEPPTIEKNELKEGGYWQTNGAWKSSTDYNSVTTNLIPVTAGDTLSYKGFGQWAGASVIWYNSNNNILSYEQYDATSNAVTITAPDNAAYVQCYSMSNTIPILEVKWINCQAVITDYQWTNTGRAFVPADYESEIIDHEKRIVELESKTTESVLKGKTIIYDGDSICFGSSNGGGYAKLIGEQTGGYYVNEADGGKTLTTQGNKDKSIADNLENLPENCDLYCFQGGINDWWFNNGQGKKLGTYDKTNFDGTLDKTTVCGALETIFRYALDNFVGKPVCFVITHKVMASAYTTNKEGNTFEDYRNAMVGICNKYSIPYYDAFNESGLNGWNAVQKNSFFADADGIHPNEEGYKRYYVPQLISLFEKIMPR